MFDNLTERLNRTLKNISGKGRITEDNIKDTLREVRTALLEADVALPVVKSFTQKVKEKALGQEVSLSLTPGQEFIKTVYAQLVEIMGGETAEINLATQPPAVILLAGLQGAGKTTSAAKLALYIKERLKKKVLMVSVDTYRPAAIDQLLTLAKEINVDAFPSDPKSTPEAIAAAALAEAKARFYDVLIVDTAGRLAVDEFMMDEVKKLHAVVNPIETLFVVDAMTGQDAANTAKAFAEALPLTGVILTKADGDARGGAALSVREITGKPIKFIGMGEKVAALEPFHPDRIASRILDMGDLLSLIEQLQRSTDVEKAKKMAEKIRVMIPEEEVDAKIKELGARISEKFAGESVHLICILKGSVFFVCELAKRITVPVTIDFMQVSSYGAETKSSGVVRLSKDLDEPLQGKNVIIVEDIIDSGRTLSHLVKLLAQRNPKTMTLCTLLDKPSRRVVDVDVEYTGFQIPDEFVVGYGLDYDQKYRNLPYIGVIEFVD